MAEISLPTLERPVVLIRASGETSPLELDGEALIALYKTHGALLLRGFATDLPAFHGFTAQFCASSVFNESPDRQLLDDARNIQSVNGGSDPFPLHPELSREPWKPDVCFFCCLEPPSSGGATTIADGVELVRRLPAAMVEALRPRKLVYVQPATPELLEFWLGTADPGDALLAAPPARCPYFFRRTPAGIVRAFARPVLHTPMFTEGPAWGNFLLFARYYLQRAGFPVLDTGQPLPDAWLAVVKQEADRLTLPVAWQRGDLLMLDNTRFMHGRTAIADARERLIASYFGYLKFAVPDRHEPRDAPWRQGAFRPPARGPQAASAAA